MKKTLSLLLSLFLLLSLSSAAFADDLPAEFNWDNVSRTVEEVFRGHQKFWMNEELDAVIWLPDIFLPVELSEEDTANGITGFFVEEESQAYVIFTYSEMSGLDLDSLFSYFSQNGHDVKMVTVNGIPAILDRNAESNTFTLTFYTRDNMFFQVIASPISDEDSVQLYEMVFSSIQPTIKEEAAEPPAPVNPVSGLISK